MKARAGRAPQGLAKGALGKCKHGGMGHVGETRFYSAKGPFDTLRMLQAQEKPAQLTHSFSLFHRQFRVASCLLDAARCPLAPPAALHLLLASSASDDDGASFFLNPAGFLLLLLACPPFPLRDGGCHPPVPLPFSVRCLVVVLLAQPPGKFVCASSPPLPLRP